MILWAVSASLAGCMDMAAPAEAEQAQASVEEASPSLLSDGAPVGTAEAAEKPTASVSLITDRSGASEAAGPSAVKWGFMCSIAARRGASLYAVNFTRPPDVPWDATTPNEAPVAFWKREGDGRWRALLLDSPTRTYQTPTLLLGPDGRASVFTLKPGDGTLYWFQGRDPRNDSFVCREIRVGWGAYLGGAIDARGRALLVYWANGRSDPNKTGFEAMTGGYRRSTIGYTLVDTVKGTSVNGIIDAPGAPYCYSHVVFDRRGAHVFTVRAEVKEWLLCRSRNHYTDLRYYYTPDPASGEKWRRVTVYQDARASIQPLGMEVDPAGRVHLLYYYVREEEDGRVTPHRLVYAVSRQPVRRERMPNVRIWPHQTALHGEPGHPSPEFVQHTLKSDGWDGRLFQTRSGRIGVLAYRAGLAAEWTEVKDGIAGKFTPWVACDLTVPQCRIFPISRRSGAALTEEIEGVFLGVPNRPERHSMFHFRLPLPAAQTVRR